MSILLVLSFIGLAFGLVFVWLFAILEVANHHHLKSMEKVAGILGMFFFPVVGTIVYYYIVKPRINRRLLTERVYI